MKHYIVNIILFLSLLVFYPAGKASSQVTHSSDWTLSMLRGSWTYHTFDEKWTLVFKSDHNLIIDRNDAQYTLLPGAIRVKAGDDSTEYPYTLNGNKLTLQLPDGSERTYKKNGDGETEHNVKGILYAEIDSTGRKAHLSFDGEHTFALTDEVGEDIGTYRVEGSTIVLTLNDTTTYTTQIRSWNGNGSLDEVAFDGRLYATEKPAAASTTVSPSGGSSTSFFEILFRLFSVFSSSSQPEPDQSAAQTQPATVSATPDSSTPTRADNAPASKPVRNFGSKRPKNQ
jgi:hypothetical protein